MPADLGFLSSARSVKKARDANEDLRFYQLSPRPAAPRICARSPTQQEERGF